MHARRPGLRPCERRSSGSRNARRRRSMRRAEVSIETGAWERLKDEAFPIRWTVFVEEQNVPPDIEADEWDARSLHALARGPDGRPLGTARLLPDGHIGRVAVLREARGTGVGVALME